MKKISLTIFAFILLSSAANAQGFYIRAGLGYAFPQAGQTMYDTNIPYNIFPTGINGTRVNSSSTQSYTYNIKGASFSAGLQGTVGIGYMFSRYAGIQFDALIGISPRKYTFTDRDVDLYISQTSSIPGTITTTQQAKSPTFLVPALVLQTGGDKVNLYSRFGLALPLNTKVTQVQTIQNAPGTGQLMITTYGWEIKSSFALGFAAAAGLKYKINNSMTIWGEVSLLSVSAYTKQQDLKEVRVNGNSYPVTSFNYSPTVKFSKSGTSDSTFANIPAYAQPFSNVGVNVGISFTLGNTSKRGAASNGAADRREKSTRPKAGKFR